MRFTPHLFTNYEILTIAVGDIVFPGLSIYSRPTVYIPTMSSGEVESCGKPGYEANRSVCNQEYMIIAVEVGTEVGDLQCISYMILL